MAAVQPTDIDGEDWPGAVHAALGEAGVGVVGYVPDAGHKRLIELCHADHALRVVPLTTEEEGVGLAAGAWLGGMKAVLLMQSSGVGNLPNALAMIQECGFPLVLLVTMRGQEGETNPWQRPMGAAAAPLLQSMGVAVHLANERNDVVPMVREALAHAFRHDQAVAVLIAQRVLGVKHFVEEPR